ncbi:MAG: alpha/beta hydrolase [Gammaproteobacteria bacterium]|nr:alpha/beta hydrolase [Gammaproteobacteria bacterium]
MVYSDGVRYTDPELTVRDHAADTATAPSLFLTLLEAPRALTEATTLIPAHALLTGLKSGDGHSVMTLPGFMATDRSTAVLRRYMLEWGYDANSWDLGRNLGFTRDRDLERLLDQRLHALSDASGGKVSLVGWSLGGLLAREMARRQPELVRSVITLGSPLGNPRATNAWRLYELMSGMTVDDDAIRRRLDRLRKPIPGVPMTSILSKTDAIVSWQISRLPRDNMVENIGVAASHFGMGFNPAILYAVADRLRQPDGEWSRFEIVGMRNLFYYHA